MKLRSRVVSDNNTKRSSIVKDDNAKNIEKNAGEGTQLRKRQLNQSKNDENINLSEKENAKVIKLDIIKNETEDVVQSKISDKKVNVTPQEKRTSTKRKRTASPSDNSHKKSKFDEESFKDTDTCTSITKDDTLSTRSTSPQELYGFLYINTNSNDIDDVFVEDRLHNLLEKEKYLPTSPVLKKENDSPHSYKRLHEKTRQNYQCIIVHISKDKFAFRSETTSLAMAIYDDCWRYRLVDASNSKILAIASLYIATKYEEVKIPAIEDFAKQVSNDCTRDDVSKAEVDILKLIDFNVIRPLSVEISRNFAIGLKYPSIGSLVLDYICFSVAADNSTAHLKPSLVASCAVIIACEIFNIKPDSDRLHLMRNISGNDFDKFLPIVCEVIINNINSYIPPSNDVNIKNNGINATFDRSKFLKATRYLNSRVTQLVGFLETLHGKCE
uniref:CYCLIN domain-containing protein n=1 Tax=Parastrongyloides trichosuri TaxID=131310 RepID=A0A0N5A5L7_PARTI